MCSTEVKDSAAGEDACGPASNLLECVDDSSVAIRSKQLQNFKQRGAAKYQD
jgi:hypothetical protein